MKHRARYITGGIVLFIIALLVAARLYLGVWALNYVNGVLGNIQGYEGSVEALDIDLYRGAYRVHKLKLYKKSGNIPTPFLDIDKADLSIQWSALFHGRIVSNVELIEPVINFAVNKSGTAAQTGAGVDWNKPLKDLMPIDINLVTFNGGKLTYQDFSASPKVNIYIHNMNGEARNLRNVEDKSDTMPSDIIVKGSSIGGGNLDLRGKMNILKPIPDMDLKLKLEHVNLPALSDYSNAYAAVDIKAGNLNVYSEFTVKNNHVSGYLKPIATNVSLIDLSKTTNPVKLAWEGVVAIVAEIFTNQPKDQLATKIPFEGNLNDVNTDTWATIGGILRNAFIQSFKNGLENEKNSGANP